MEVVLLQKNDVLWVITENNLTLNSQESGKSTVQEGPATDQSSILQKYFQQYFSVSSWSDFSSINKVSSINSLRDIVVQL